MAATTTNRARYALSSPGDASRAMTRYQRQVLMSLVHQLSYRPLGEVSNIGVTEAGWGVQRRRRPSLPRHIDATIAIKTRYSGTFSTSTAGRRRHLVSVRHLQQVLHLQSSFPHSRDHPRSLIRALSLSLSLFLSIDRSLSSTVLQVDTPHRANTARTLRHLSSRPRPYSNSLCYRIFCPMFLAYFTWLVAAASRQPIFR